MPKTSLDPVLVTGAAGFVGANVVRRLLATGAAVHAVVHEARPAWRLAGLPPALAVHTADLRNAREVAAVFEAVSPRVVIHLATHGAYEWQAAADAILETNVLGSLNVLEAAVRTGARLLVTTGSSSEYGYRDAPMREEDRLEPNSVYAVGKAAQTHLTALYSRLNGLPAVVFRLFSVFGPWEEPGRLLPTLIRKVRAGEPLDMVDPDVARDFVYVDDVVDAIVDLRRLSPFHGDVFNLGSGTQVTMREIVAAAQEILGREAVVRWGAMPRRRWDTTRWECDPAKAREVLGWTARRSLKEGLARMASWMAEVGDAYGPA